MALQYMMTDTSGDAERRRLRGRRKVGSVIRQGSLTRHYVMKNRRRMPTCRDVCSSHDALHEEVSCETMGEAGVWSNAVNAQE